MINVRLPDFYQLEAGRYGNYRCGCMMGALCYYAPGLNSDLIWTEEILREAMGISGKTYHELVRKFDRDPTLENANRLLNPLGYNLIMPGHDWVYI